MKWTFLFARALLITTIFDFSVISLLLYVFGDFTAENLLLGWAAILVIRFALWLRVTGLRIIEFYAGRASAIDGITRILRTNEVSRNYTGAWDFETLANEVHSDSDASIKAKQLISELIGFRQGLQSVSPILGVLYALKMDRAAARYLA